MTQHRRGAPGVLDRGLVGLPHRRRQPVPQPVLHLDDRDAGRLRRAVLGAYPLAYFLAFVAGRHRYTILLAVLAPFFTSYLLRVIAWQVILNNNGVINSLLWQLGLRAQGHAISWLIYSKFSVDAGAVLRLGAVRGAADLRGARQPRPAPARCRPRPRRGSLLDLPAGDAADEPARGGGRVRVRADPDHRRVHRAAARGRAVQPAVRQLDPGVLLRHAGLELRLGAGADAGGRGAGAAGAVRPLHQHGSDRGETA